LDVAWVGVDDGSYERVVSLDVKFTWGEPDTVVFRKWVGNNYVEVVL